MKKQTAVEWLIAEIQRLPLEYRLEKQHLYYHALKMEKEQIISAYQSDRTPCSDEDAEQYYNETYGGEE
jgi:heat shock protein HspQ